MSTVKKWILYLMVATGGSPQIFGQTEWPLQHIDKKSGLSNSAINTIYMDHQDYVWFGTWDGLNRYDGEDIISYKPVTDDPYTLSNNVIRQILEDKHQNLWIITHDGINRYDRILDLFHRYLADIDEVPFLENNLKATLSDDSTLYISLIGWGVGRYMADADTFLRLSPTQTALKNIHSIGVHAGYLYMIDGNGTLFVQKETDDGFTRQAAIDWLPNGAFLRFAVFDGRYFLLYQQGSDKLIINELRDGQVVSSGTVDTHGAQVTAWAKSKNQAKAYYGTDEGDLFLLELIDGNMVATSLRHLTPDLHQRKLKIFSIHESKQDLLWVGTDGDGIYKYLTRARSFHAVGEGDLSAGKLSNSIVRSIYMDQQENLYLGTRSGGLNVLNKHSGKTQLYNKHNGLSDNTVLAITNDAQGNIWLGLDSEGLDMIEKETGKIRHFPADFINTPEDLYFGSVYKVFFDAYGHLWLGTSGYGIIYMDIERDANGNYHLKETYTIHPESRQFGNIRLNSNIVYSIAQEEPNILWFGTRNGGLYRYNTLTRKFTHRLHTRGDERFALSNNDILSLYHDQKNKLWVGTSGGLNQVNLSNFTVAKYSQQDGLANNTIHGILEDDHGRLWLSTNNGLFAFSPQTNTFKNFNWSDGLLNFEYTDGAYFKAPNDDRLFFGGTKGLDMVLPDKIDTSKAFPRLVLTDLLISNVHIRPNDSTGILQASIDLQDQIRLNYDQNFLSLRFTTLDFWHKQRCSYRYFLEGFDKDWIDIGSQSVINLTNIPPGQYTLHLNNSNENGNWNPEVHRLVIDIAPPFWATNTAYLLFAVLLVLSQVVLIQWLRNRAKRKKADEIQRLRQEQADSIQRYKLEFFTDIAHEFRTPLTLILGPAASLLEKSKNDPSMTAPLQSIYRNSLRLQKLIQELIQFRKVELGKEHLKPRPVKLNTFVEELLQSFRQYALDKDIMLTYEAPDGLNGTADTEILEKILINLVSNALKYTEQEGKVHVKIWKAQSRLHFSVADSGIGIQPHELDKVFERFTDIHREKSQQTANSVGIGLSLTRKLVHLHGGDIMVESTPGRGSTFTFWIPVKPDVATVPQQDAIEQTTVTQLNEHVQAEFYHRQNLDQELINISLERFDHNVLVVDDNLQVLNLLKDLLAQKYNVVTCTSGTQALDVLTNRKIDVVVSDVIMPEMDGYTLCSHIKHKIETSHIPVILLTAKGEIEERIEGLQAGADAYIPKPFHPRHLYVRLEKLIQTREVLKQKFEAYSFPEKEFSSFGIGAKDDEFFRAIDEFIKAEMGNPQLDAQHLAAHVGMSKTSLYKKIRTLTGQTPHALINQYRLKKAAFLLKNSEYNVSEIINLTGFNSRSYFYKSFQDMFHCSPTGYAE